MSENIKYSLKNLLNRKQRSILTIISIFIGITTIFIFVSFGWGLYDYVKEFTTSSSADKVTIISKGAGIVFSGMDPSFVLTEDDIKAIERTPGVFKVAGIYAKPAKIKHEGMVKYVFLIGFKPQDEELITDLFNIEIDKGRKLNKNDKGKVVLGYNYQIKDRIFPRAFELNNKIEIEGKKFRIIGFFEAVGNPQDDSNIYMSEKDIRELYFNSTQEIKGYNWAIAKVDLENIDRVITEVEKNLRESRGQKEGEEDFFVESFQDLLKTYTKALDVVIAFVILISLISVIVSSVNTANTMITSVLERTREIGVLKAIGARNREIFKIFLFESSLLGFIGGVLGVLVGWMITYALKNILDSFGWGFLTPHYSTSLFVTCILFATITGAISGAIPAMQASKIKVVDALRYE